MLQSIREKTQGMLAWGIIVLIIVVFSLWGINNYSRGFGRGGSIAAKVDGKSITWREVEYLAEKQRQHLLESNPQLLNQLDPKFLRDQAQMYLAQQLALDLQAKKQGFLISEKQVIKQIASDPKFQEQGKFSADKYKQFLHEISDNEETFTDKVRSSMVLNQLRNGFIASSFILKNEIERIRELFFQQRDFGYLIVPSSKFKQEVSISKEEIKKYFNRHQHLLIAPEQVKLSYVELTVDALAKNIPVTDDILKEYYQKHETLYTVPEEVEVRHILINAPKGSDFEKSGEARAKIDDIMAKIKLGEDFVNLAKQYSQDPISAVNGGKLEKIGRGQTVAEFETAAFGLTKEKEISEVIQTEYGYHIIQLLKKYGSYVKPYGSIHDLLVENYRRETAESQLADKGEELANLAFEYPDSLQYAAEKMQLSIQETGLFSKDNVDGIASIPAVAKAAFAKDMLKQKRNSDLIKVDDERYVVIRVKEHVTARPLKLAEVKDKIEETLILEITKKRAENFGKMLLTKLQEGNAPHAIAKEVNLEWITKQNVERNDNKINPALVQKVFALPKPEANKPIHVGFSLLSGDYAILTLQNVKLSDKVNNAKMQEQFQQQIAMIIAQTEFQLYEQAMIEQAKIKIESLK